MGFEIIITPVSPLSAAEFGQRQIIICIQRALVISLLVFLPIYLGRFFLRLRLATLLYLRRRRGLDVLFHFGGWHNWSPGRTTSSLLNSILLAALAVIRAAVLLKMRCCIFLRIFGVILNGFISRSSQGAHWNLWFIFFRRLTGRNVLFDFWPWRRAVCQLQQRIDNLDSLRWALADLEEGRQRVAFAEACMAATAWLTDVLSHQVAALWAEFEATPVVSHNKDKLL